MIDENNLAENPGSNEQVLADNPTTTEQQETQKEYNLRIMRQRITESDARAAAAEQRLQEVEKMIRAQQSNTVEHEDADDFNIEDDGYPDNKIIKKIYNQFNKKLQKTQEELNQYRSRSTAEQAELRLKAQYSDFDQIVTSENIKRLQVMEPEEYSSMISNPDTYAKAKTAYNMIKRNNLYDKYEDIDKKIEANKSKPRSPSTAGAQNAETPLTKIGDYDRRVLTEEQKEFYRKQVADAKKYR
jgi:hypothetical protein